MAKKKQTPKGSESEEEQFNVEVITKCRINEDGEWEYYVKWANYDSDENTWEPEENLRECERLLASFWNEIGLDDEDYLEGFETAPSPEWIKKERDFFARNVDARPKPKSSTAGKAHLKHKSTESLTQLGESSKSMKTTQRRSSSAAKDTSTRQQKTDLVLTIPDSESSDSDHPLSRSVPSAISSSKQRNLAGKRFVKKPHRQTLVKEMPTEFTRSAIGNVTKATIALQHSASAVQVPAPKLSKPLLAGLSFKKKSTADQPGPTLTSDSDVPEVVQSPGSMSSDMNVLDAVSSESRRKPLPLPRRTSFIPPPSDLPSETDLPSEADRFLSSIMPPALTEPMIEMDTQEDNSASNVTMPRLQPKQQNPSRIPKKWKWEGELFMEVGPDRAESLCNIILSEATDPRPTGYRLSMLLASADSLRMKKLCSVRDIWMILRGCTAVQQFARVSHQEDSDASALNALSDYMGRNDLFSYACLCLENDIVATLLVFPSRGHFLETLEVPTEFRQSGLLLVALIPTPMTSDEYQRLQWRTLQEAPEQEVYQDFLHENKFSLAGSRFHQALHILGVPRVLLDFLSRARRRYCIWHCFANRTTKELDSETTLLKTVLDSLHAEDTGHKADVRIIFVHVGAVSTLQDLEALSVRRNKHPQLQFWTYGTDESVHPDRWGVRLIYPCGGIGTFTPSAIIEHLDRIDEKIKQIAQHPLWHCYVLPSVVAMVAMLTCDPDTDPLSAFDQGDLFAQKFIQVIEDGELAVTHAPPPLGRASLSNDPVGQWVGQYLNMSLMKTRDILSECLRIFREEYPGVDVRSTSALERIERDIVQDMAAMQVQPCIMDNFRRFVVVRRIGSTPLKANYGIEDTTLPQFDLKDDYFAEN